MGNCNYYTEIESPSPICLVAYCFIVESHSSAKICCGVTHDFDAEALNVIKKFGPIKTSYRYIIEEKSIDQFNKSLRDLGVECNSINMEKHKIRTFVERFRTIACNYGYNVVAMSKTIAELQAELAEKDKVIVNLTHDVTNKKHEIDIIKLEKQILELKALNIKEN